MLKYYIQLDAKFNPRDWATVNYNNIRNSYHETTNNLAESLNAMIGKAIPEGTVSFHAASCVIHTVKNQTCLNKIALLEFEQLPQNRRKNIFVQNFLISQQLKKYAQLPPERVGGFESPDEFRKKRKAVLKIARLITETTAEAKTICSNNELYNRWSETNLNSADSTYVDFMPRARGQTPDTQPVMLGHSIDHEIEHDDLQFIDVSPQAHRSPIRKRFHLDMTPLSEPSTSGSNRGGSRGSSRGSSRGDGRGSSRDDGRGSSRGPSRGDGRGSSRGPSRGSSRGNSRGDNRGSSRGDGRGSNRGPSRGDGRGSSRGPSRGSSRGDGRGGNRGASRGSSRGDGRGNSRGISRENNRRKNRDSEGSGDSNDTFDGTTYYSNYFIFN